MATDPPRPATTEPFGRHFQSELPAESGPASFLSPRCRTACLLAWCLFIVTLTVGCGSAPPERRGSTLTQAADEAQKKDPAKKKVLTTTPDEDQDKDAEETAIAAVGVMAATSSMSSTSSDSTVLGTAPIMAPIDTVDNDRYAISVVGGFGTVDTDQFDGFGAFGIGGSFMEGPMRADLWLLYLPTNLTEESGVAVALVDEYELAADLRVRYRFTPEHTFAGIYALIGVRLGTLTWTYQNGVVVTDDYGNPETISDDWLTYYAGYLGVGVSPVQTDHILLGVDVSAGLKTYKSYTDEGFKQDLFDDWIGFGQILISADYRF